jgi:hypothetical protein
VVLGFRGLPEKIVGTADLVAATPRLYKGVE